MNIAIGQYGPLWLSLFGLPMRMYGAAGDDYYGGVCINQLEAVGVDCSGVQVIPGAQTRVYLCSSLRTVRK